MERCGFRVSIDCYSLWAFDQVEVGYTGPEEAAAAAVEAVDCKTAEVVGYFDNHHHTVEAAGCCSCRCMRARVRAGRSHILAVVEEGHNRAVVEEHHNLAEEEEDRSFEEGRSFAVAGRGIAVLGSKTCW